MSELRVATLQHEAAAASNITLDANGNVGVGTSSPSSRLHIAGGAESTIRNTASSGSSWFVGSNTAGYILHNESNTPMLFTTNGIERIRIDSAGRVTMPYQPAFTVYGGSDVIGATTALVWTLTELNRGGFYNTSNGRFTCPVTGVYVFHYRWTTAQGVAAQPRLFTNNVGIEGATQYSNPPAGSYSAGCISVAIQCNANDYITCGTLTGQLIVGPNYNSGFSGHLLG